MAHNEDAAWAEWFERAQPFDGVEEAFRAGYQAQTRIKQPIVTADWTKLKPGATALEPQLTILSVTANQAMPKAWREAFEQADYALAIAERCVDPRGNALDQIASARETIDAILGD